VTPEAWSQELTNRVAKVVQPSEVEAAVSALTKFRDLVRNENQVQNLTRLLSDEEFLEGHFQDCFEVLAAAPEIRERSCFDLGSGAGVPGIPTAILAGKSRWTLSESELGKAKHLENVVQELSLKDRVRVMHGRAEKTIGLATPEVVLSRAVGKVGKILEWIERCSTWNTLILFKGPSWETEWADYVATTPTNKNRPAVIVDHKYQVMAGDGEAKSRRILVLRRS